jgi:hypothetical protein
MEDIMELLVALEVNALERTPESEAKETYLLG